MVWKTVLEWEKENGKEYPYWGCVWSYDGYGECWGSEIWRDTKDYYIKERALKRGTAAWDFQFEPMVLDVNLPRPKWGDGQRLIRNAIIKEEK